MRFLSAIVCCAMVILPLCAEGQTKVDGAHIRFAHSEWDFKNIQLGGENPVCTFRFVNDGTEPLVVFATATTCKCVQTEFSRKPIAVGESGEIRVIIDTKKLDKGVFRRVIQVRSNSVGGVENLTIEGVAKE